MARRLNHSPTLAYALAAYIPAHLSPTRTNELMPLATELVHVATDTREMEREAEGYLLRACLRLELGETERAKADVARMATIAEELRQPSQRLYVANVRAHVALLEGQFADAERLIHEGLELGDRAQQWNARITYRLQLYLLRKAQDRLAELAEIYEAHPNALEFRTYRVFDCIMARFYDEMGRHAEAKAKFEALAQHDFAGVPVDEEWLASICLLAEAAASFGDLPRARLLYGFLLPYRDRVGTSYPEMSLGAVSRYLGLLSAVDKCWPDAVEHFEDALAINERIGARPWLAYTQQDYAQMLLARGEPGDETRSRRLLNQALSTYRELGMAERR
jgi:tetratricopeptide (TPR) repeat protein